MKSCIRGLATRCITISERAIGWKGLTTYLANYYYDERTKGEDTARAHRKRMLMEYNLYVQPADDYPVVKFHHKENRVDNAIGYQKTAMLFHMLRRELGDRDFFRAIRAMIAGYSGRFADWPQVRQAFEDASGKELSWFFNQWVHGKGTPHLRLAQARVERDPPNGLLGIPDSRTKGDGLSPGRARGGAVGTGPVSHLGGRSRKRTNHGPVDSGQARAGATRSGV